MGALASFVLRLAAMTIAAALLAGATLTLAAERVRAPRQQPGIVRPALPRLTVPDVTGQAYVFAKGILQDSGFAWHVTGPVQGFAANVVANQNPSAGTAVVDTGAPAVVLTLQRNSSYVERGTPDNDAPYAGTRVELAGNTQARPAFTPRLQPVAVPAAPHAKPKRQTVTAPPLQAKAPEQPATVVPTTSAPAAPAAPAPAPAVTAPGATAPVTTPPAIPAATVPATAAPAPATTVPAAPAATVPAAPAATVPAAPVATVPAGPSTVPTTPPAAPAPTAPPAPAPPATAPSRQPDFVVPGAPKEPSQAQSLPDRAQALAAWLEQHREPTAENLNYWLYEHAYIVAGAKFGWWHGVEALQTLIAVDQRAEVLWGVGKQSEEAARKALVEVAGRTR